MLAQGLGPLEDYQTIDLRILARSAPNTPYTAEVDVVGWRAFRNLTVALDLDHLDSLEADPHAYGLALGRGVFDPTACGDAYREIMAVFRGRGDGLRVRLMVDAPDLQAIRWERMYHLFDGEWRPLSSTGATPFSRTVPVKQWDRPLPITHRPLRMLAVIASPSAGNPYGLDPIGSEGQSSLHALFDRFADISAVYLESGADRRPTLDELRRALAEGYDLVHFLCHGAQTPGGTVLFLEDQHSAVTPVTAERIISTVKALAAPPVFCFLAVCESAARARYDAFAPLGPALVQDGGVHATAAMTQRVGLNTAQQFTEQFYTRLLAHGVVDLAVNEARALVQDAWDWGAPVLFSRLPDNQLIDFPIGQIYPQYLSHSEHAFHAADEALAAARLEDHGQQLVKDLEALIKELSESHKILAKTASNFRRTGFAPDTFPAKFEAFYYDFKAFYDDQTWVGEGTSCRQITAVGARILPKLGPLMDRAAIDKLREELRFLGQADNDMLRYFREYLELMNQWVEELWTLLMAGQVAEAIAAKRDMDAQISPSLQRSKKVFDDMNKSITAVAAA